MTSQGIFKREPNRNRPTFARRHRRRAHFTSNRFWGGRLAAGVNFRPQKKESLSRFGDANLPSGSHPAGTIIPAETGAGTKTMAKIFRGKRRGGGKGAGVPPEWNVMNSCARSQRKLPPDFIPRVPLRRPHPKSSSRYENSAPCSTV